MSAGTCDPEYMVTAPQVFAKMNNFMPVAADMKLVTLPDYDALSLVLQKTALKLHPSQVHGLTCGLLCGRESINESAWEKLMVKNLNNQAIFDATQTDEAVGKQTKAHEVLNSVFETSKRQLEDFLFEFELMLPDDSQKLTVRAEALTLWCQGFLIGLKMVKIPIVGRETGEVTEAINDLVEIAQMNYEEVVDSDEDEAAYIELVEFVRVAVILIYQDEMSKKSQEINASNAHLH